MTLTELPKPEGTRGAAFLQTAGHSTAACSGHMDGAAGGQGLTLRKCCPLLFWGYSSPHMHSFTHSHSFLS